MTNTSSFENMPSNLSHDRTQAAEIFTWRNASSSQTKLIAGDLKGEDVFVGRLACLLAVVLHDEKDRHWEFYLGLNSADTKDIHPVAKAL